MDGQMNIFDWEYDRLQKVLDILEMAKISNKFAYYNNVYQKMGFDTAADIIKHELERGHEPKNMDEVHQELKPKKGKSL